MPARAMRCIACRTSFERHSHSNAVKCPPCAEVERKEKARARDALRYAAPIEFAPKPEHKISTPASTETIACRCGWTWYSCDDARINRHECGDGDAGIVVIDERFAGVGVQHAVGEIVGVG